MKIVLTIVGGIGVVVADQRRAIELFLTALLGWGGTTVHDRIRRLLGWLAEGE